MPGDPLPRQRDRIFFKQSRTYLEQCLIVPSAKFIEDQQARIVAQGAKHMAELWIKWNTHPSFMQQLCCM